MPEIVISHIVSCSSADKNNPAENLLKAEGTHKWKSAAAGEKGVSCVLQLNKSSEIHSIDIGNEGSAFVEVLVGKATAAADQDFEVLLAASAFMSPLESRNGTNRNSVRMFGLNALNKTTAGQKWDRVKVVCTQPFSKLFQYGLSFIKFHSPPDDGKQESKVKKLGAFTLKDVTDEDEEIQAGLLFANRSKKAVSPPPTPKGAAAVRAASKMAEEHLKSPLPATSSPAATTARKRLAPSPPPSSSKAKVKKKDDSPSKGDSDTDKDDDDDVAPPRLTLQRQSTSLSSVASSSSNRDKPTPLKRIHTEPATPSPGKAFTKLMEGVVFALSGFQNPRRGELRTKALEMGAKYQQDWNRFCTHLVCAFPNTPKYRQVAGKGKIVTQDWITDCYKQKKLLPWRKYQLGDAGSPDESSDEEEQAKAPAKKVSPPSSARPKSLSSSAKKTSPPSSSHSQTPNKQTTKPANVKAVVFDDDSDSGGDTEEEVRKSEERAKKKNAQSTPPQVSLQKSNRDDPYGGSTDEDEDTPSKTVCGDTGAKDDGSDSGLPDLPEFFTDKHFFFYGDFDGAEQRLLTRYIAAFNGEVEDYISKRVNFVITSQKWDNNFEDALNENPNLVFVKPKWIFMCHEKNKLQPYQPYNVVPP